MESLAGHMARHRRDWSPLPFTNKPCACQLSYSYLPEFWTSDSGSISSSVQNPQNTKQRGSIWRGGGDSGLA